MWSVIPVKNEEMGKQRERERERKWTDRQAKYIKVAKA